MATRGLRQFASSAPVARYLRLAGYVKVPGKRRYIDPTGREVSRRQAEQTSGALSSIYGVRSREQLTAEAPVSRRRRYPIRNFATDWKACHNDPRSVAAILKDAEFREDVAFFRNRAIPWKDRREFAKRNFCWEWDQPDHSWRYPRV